MIESKFEKNNSNCYVFISRMTLNLKIYEWIANKFSCITKVEEFFNN